MTRRDDVLVVGNGPAGLAAAAALAGAGLSVGILAPSHDRPWPNTYGIWEDELGPVRFDGLLAARWPAVTVAFDRAPRRLDRAYGLVDNQRLRAELLSRCARAGARPRRGRAVSAEHDPSGSVVVTAAGERLGCRLVVDAGGHRPTLLTSSQATVTPPAFQSAYGILGRFSAPPIPSGAMVLMDYRDAPLAGIDGVHRDPTFLYAMDLGGGRVFVEETSLARRQALGFAPLEQRLRARLAGAGASVLEVLAVERCRFPMGVPLPSRPQRVVGYGAAGGFVHPASGYSLGAALTRALALAAAVAGELARPGGSPTSAAAAAWAAVWPEDLVRQRALHEFGLQTLLGLDLRQTQAFFATFFDLPAERWRGYLSGAASSRELLATMLALFARAPGGLRAALAREASPRRLALLARGLG